MIFSIQPLLELVFVLFIAAPPAPAAQQPGGCTAENAARGWRQDSDEGKRLYEAGDYAGARSCFARSFRKRPEPLVLVRVAEAEEALGLNADAIVHFEEAKGLFNEGDRNRQRADEHCTRLRAVTPQMQINASAEARADAALLGLTLKVDDKPQREDPWGQPFFVNPFGTKGASGGPQVHTIVATTRWGTEYWRESRIVGEEDGKRFGYLSLPSLANQLAEKNRGAMEGEFRELLRVFGVQVPSKAGDAKDPVACWSDEVGERLRRLAPLEELPWAKELLDELGAEHRRCLGAYGDLLSYFQRYGDKFVLGELDRSVPGGRIDASACARLDTRQVVDLSTRHMRIDPELKELWVQAKCARLAGDQEATRTWFVRARDRADALADPSARAALELDQAAQQERKRP